MKAHSSILLALAVMLSACNATTNKEERMGNFNQKLSTITCEELRQEIDYQKRIRFGIIERQQQEVTVGDFPATALMLGMNVAMNQSNKSERNDRLEELDEKIAQLTVKKRTKCE